MSEKEVTLNDGEVSPSFSSGEPIHDKAAERRLVRKLDLRIIPILWILYLVNFLDRANIGNAKIAGMEKELHLVGQRFNIAAWVFNLGYLVAGVPLTILFKRYGPKSLCVMMITWGITVIGCGLVKTWGQLVVTRLLEGMAESAFISGAAYLIGAYYTTDEYMTRYVWFLTAGILAGAINGFVSALLVKMDGTGGYAAWRWIFIMEGIITIAIASLSYPFIVPFPEDATFLSGPEKALMLERTKKGGHNANDTMTWAKAIDCFKDWRIWAGVAMNLGVTESANSISNFQPTILKGLGYTSTQAQVHTVPVYVTGAAVSVIVCVISERMRKRYPFYILGCIILIIGLSIMIAYPPDPKIRYLGMFFMASGCYTAMPISIIWSTLNTSRGYQRAFAIGMILNFGTAGAFISSNVFLLKETPRFHTGFSTGLGLAFIGAAAATLLFVFSWWNNKKRDEKRGGNTEIVSGTVADLGSKHPDFRFYL
ncbi:MFS general substrate transporter [Massarina eburnea CBS 473.64]|uniref:MFS general substrate transporter n=1 Tax=Massarina eburnea CBS 473.64 TaxID=1395130 RepID=A0A6A6RR79_9PLEO|nr:MFS general substrate transporter [Massarina eburnea CBS 473.64]